MHNPLILIADANAHIRCFLQRELTAQGFDVALVKVHTEILKWMDAVKRPDLVILDPDIPFIGGNAVLLRIRSKAPQVPVIVYTAYSEDAENPVFEQADAIVEKIPNPALLIRTVRWLLGDHEKSLPYEDACSGKETKPGGQVEK